jgi:hypothetical protein
MHCFFSSPGLPLPIDDLINFHICKVLNPAGSHSLHEVLLGCKGAARLEYDISEYGSALDLLGSLSFDLVPTALALSTRSNPWL